MGVTGSHYNGVKFKFDLLGVCEDVGGVYRGWSRGRIQVQNLFSFGPSRTPSARQYRLDEEV